MYLKSRSPHKGWVCRPFMQMVTLDLGLRQVLAPSNSQPARARPYGKFQRAGHLQGVKIQSEVGVVYLVWEKGRSSFPGRKAGGWAVSPGDTGTERSQATALLQWSVVKDLQVGKAAHSPPLPVSTEEVLGVPLTVT